ncbi:carboxypeptidase-like regulatory domain-containing protein [Clostridium ihumii]|uniref:carboxypeptidase-like regulatory domain-containing protein n=1 Tax=Clostridium ihumii TaxID=1470356 RepID=UPI00058D0ECB|nr:carboxypeptidase-like regulatory domain-containing protein [Clostridium ihumii]
MKKKIKVVAILTLLIGVITIGSIVFAKDGWGFNRNIMPHDLMPFVKFDKLEDEYKIYSKVEKDGENLVLASDKDENVIIEREDEGNPYQSWILELSWVDSDNFFENDKFAGTYYTIKNKATGKYLYLSSFSHLDNKGLTTKKLEGGSHLCSMEYCFGFGTGEFSKQTSLGDDRFDLTRTNPNYYYIQNSFGGLTVTRVNEEKTATIQTSKMDFNKQDEYIFTFKKTKSYKHSIKGQVYQLPLSYDNKEYNLISEASIYEKNSIKDMVKNDGKDFDKLLNENKVIDDCKVEIVNKADDDKLKLNRDGTFEILTNKDEIEINLKRDGYEDVGATINIKDCEKSEFLAFMKEFKEVKTVLKGKVLEVTGNDKAGVFYTEQSSTKGISAKIKLIDSEGTSKELRSNSSGIFSFEDMALGEYKLDISASEYDTKKINESKIVLKEEENNIYIYLEREIKDDGKNPEAEIMFEYNSEDEGAFTSAKSTLTNYSEPVYVLKGWIEYNDGTKEKWDVDKDKKNLIVKFDDKSVKKSSINKNAVIYYEIVDMKGNKSTISETLVLKQDR